jgi:hypothetical protein
MIPKRIHQIWIGTNPPENIQGWMNFASTLEGWEYTFWNEEKIIAQYSQDFYDLYKNCNTEFQADIYRMLVVRDFGGFYLDCTCEILKDFSCWCDSKFLTSISLWTNKNPSLMAEFIGSEKQGRLIKLLCQVAPLHVVPIDGIYNFAHIKNFSMTVSYNIQQGENLIGPPSYNKYIKHHFSHSFLI